MARRNPEDAAADLFAAEAAGAAEPGQEAFAVLSDCAARKKLAAVVYRKHFESGASLVRVVEPYTLVTGKQDTMALCWQREPEEGWRYFMLHKLDRVEPLAQGFKPRRKVDMHEGTVSFRYKPDPAWTAEMATYRDVISDALADGTVSADEWNQIANFRNGARTLTMDQVRFVHASLFHRLLGAIIDDGQVSEDERRQLALVHSLFHSLGWTVGQ
jgi:predicted DNA-binding transcriptional regulator YafY